MQSLYPNFYMRTILKVVGLSVGSWYDKRMAKAVTQKPGPRPKHSDEQVLCAVRAYLKNPEFYMEGYKKIKVRLAQSGVYVGKERLRLLLSQHGLLCHQSHRSLPTIDIHDGRILTNRPNQMWGMDIKEFRVPIGKLYFFDIVDHYNSEVKGWHLSQDCTRKEAMQALRHAIRSEFDHVEKDVCKDQNLSLRVDHGTQFDSKDFNRELQFLGIAKSSAFVRSPQSNGVVERFHRTIKEQLVDIHSVKDLSDAKIKIDHFVKKYNQKWLLHRLGLQSPLDYKKNQIPSGNREPKGVRHRVKDSILFKKDSQA